LLRSRQSPEYIKSLGLVFGDIRNEPHLYPHCRIPLDKAYRGPHLRCIVTDSLDAGHPRNGRVRLARNEPCQKGEGGTIVLQGIARPHAQIRPQSGVLFTFLSFIGISLLIGDGVITPAISILSAVEGLLLIPGLENTAQDTLIVIAGIIAILLFSFQKKGTEKVSVAIRQL